MCARRVQDTNAQARERARAQGPTRLRRLAGDRDELQVHGELAFEAFGAARADRLSRLLVHELLAAARAAALLELVQIELHLHD
jgi:hypothetical protein